MFRFGQFLAPGLSCIEPLSSALFAPPDDGGSGGGTDGGSGVSGGGNGAGDGGGGQGDEVPAGVRDFILRTVNGSVNSAITSHLERKLAPAIEGALNPFLEKLKGGGGQGGGGDGQGKQDSGKGDATQNQIKALQAQLDDEKRLREETQRKAAEGRRDALLGEALDAIGVDPHRKRGAHAVALSNLVTLDDGSVVWRAQRKGYHEDLPLADGLKEWAGTDEGKSYLKATDDGSGTGTRPHYNGGRPGTRSSDPKVAKAQARREAGEKLLANVRGLVGTGKIRIGG